VKKIVILIDGGYLRVCARTAYRNAAAHKYDPDFIEKVAHACVNPDEEVLRVLYYDCAPYTGTVKLPVSGTDKTFEGSDEWLKRLAQKDLFAVRLGVLKFRGFKPKRIPVAAQTLADGDFKPVFEQKGVDMRIGLDIGLYSQTKTVDRIILLSGDTDCVAAMKHARKAGLQMVLVKLPTENIAGELLAHADFKREITWPQFVPALAQAAAQS
jgi:uncharacterized LabA/DUF88 family protein